MNHSHYIHKDFADTIAHVTAIRMSFVAFDIIRKKWDKDDIVLAHTEMPHAEFKATYPTPYKECKHNNKTEVENSSRYGPMKLTVCLDCKQTINTEKGW